uniref:Uncharacterized protein n=1 Tax=Eutreptiella gymnastica TaxID=73025 RepID=A0A7S1IAA2_9EUGL|mmetsp:Transcript_142491/g.248562  ORF Transcript_142491/g.248562 Transcript_142491/m.248562 type:complete len:278 (+) Transcript_142491:30-863(+)
MCKTERERDLELVANFLEERCTQAENENAAAQQEIAALKNQLQQMPNTDELKDRLQRQDLMIQFLENSVAVLEQRCAEKDGSISTLQQKLKASLILPQILAGAQTQIPATVKPPAEKPPPIQQSTDASNPSPAEVSQVHGEKARSRHHSYPAAVPGQLPSPEPSLQVVQDSKETRPRHMSFPQQTYVPPWPMQSSIYTPVQSLTPVQPSSLAATITAQPPTYSSSVGSYPHGTFSSYSSSTFSNFPVSSLKSYSGSTFSGLASYTNVSAPSWPKFAY